MKSFDELYNEVRKNEEMKKAFVTAFNEGRTEEFLKANDCDASVAEVRAFLNSTKSETALDDDLAKIAGGVEDSLSCLQFPSLVGCGSHRC